MFLRDRRPPRPVAGTGDQDDLSSLHDPSSPEESMMHDSPGVTRRAWPPVARTATAIIATAALSLLAVACSSSPSSTGASSLSSTGSGSQSSASSGGGSTSVGGSTTSQEVAYSNCVRSHGVPNFPDPPSSGKFVIPSAQQLGVSSSQLQSAENACQSQQPNTGGGEPSAALLAQQWRDMTTFAKCMRAHGEPNWPDPTPYPPEPDRPAFNVQALGIDPNSAQIVPKVNECLALQHIPSSQSGYIERFVGA
jgi:hypothetical protein